MRPYFTVVAHGARAVAISVLVVLALGGIPGSRLSRWDAPMPVASVPVPRDRDAAIDVVVHDGRGRIAVERAHVTVLAVLGERAFIAGHSETSREGEAHIAALPRGEMWVLADAPGFARGSAHIALASESRRITIDLAPGHTLKIAVHDESGQPIDGAEIEVLSADDPLPVGARTSPDGTVLVDRLGAGPWQLTARAPDYDDSEARAENAEDAVTIILRKLGTIVARVVTADGQRAEHALVMVVGASLWPARSIETDASGEVRIGGLEAGMYALRASRGSDVAPIEPGLSVGRAQEVTAVLRLAAGRFVSVRVADGERDDADPILHSRVTLAEGGLSPFPLEAATDSNGLARLGPIAVGPATVGAQADGYVSRNGVAVLDPPQETRISLDRAGVITGRVVDAEGYPIGGATIEITGTDSKGGPILEDPRRSAFRSAYFDAMILGPSALYPSGELGVTFGPVPPVPASGVYASRFAQRIGAEAEPWVTRVDGTFRAAPTSPGRIRALVRHPQYIDAQSDTVTLRPGGEADVHIVMHRGGALEGRVLDVDGRPVAASRVFASAVGGTIERMTRTASDGTFAFAALPGSIVLTTTTEDDETAATRQTVDIPEGGRQEVTVRLPASRGPLLVTVVDERGAGVGSAQVSGQSLSVAAPLRITSFTDDRGDAVLKHAGGLPLRIEATAAGRAPRVVVCDGKQASLRIVLGDAEALTGEVVTARGRDPIAGAAIALHFDGGVRRTHTDASGQYTLRDLPAGQGRLTVRAPGFASVERAITVVDTGAKRDATHERIELEEEGVVEGDVVDVNEEPIAGARVAAGLVPTWLLIGSTPSEVAVTDAKGRFTLHGLAEGDVALEAYSADLGRGRVTGIKVVAGRTTDRVRIVLQGESADAGQPPSTGGVAVTLGETGVPAAVVIASVVEGSEAERAGIIAGDVVLAVDDVVVTTIEQARAQLSGPISEDVLLHLRRGNEDLLLRVARDAVRR